MGKLWLKSAFWKAAIREKKPKSVEGSRSMTFTQYVDWDMAKGIGEGTFI